MFYTSDSFTHVFAEQHRSGFIPWQVKVLREVAPGGNEFHVLLTLD